MRETAGFTIGEVLVTVLLVGLLTAAIAAGIGVTLSSYNEIRQATEGQAMMNNAVTAVSDELRFAYDVQAVDVTDSTNIGTNGATAYAFNSSIRNYRLYLANGTDDDGNLRITLNAISAVPSDNGLYSTISVDDTSAEMPLINTNAGTLSSAATGKYRANLETLGWDTQTSMWTFTIKVTDGQRTIESGTMTVRCVNNW